MIHDPLSFSLTERRARARPHFSFFPPDDVLLLYFGLVPEFPVQDRHFSITFDDIRRSSQVRMEIANVALSLMPFVVWSGHRKVK